MFFPSDNKFRYISLKKSEAIIGLQNLKSHNLQQFEKVLLENQRPEHNWLVVYVQIDKSLIKVGYGSNCFRCRGPIKAILLLYLVYN